MPAQGCWLWGLSLLLLAACSSSPSSEDIAANNRGVGLMGRFDYAAAQAVFSTLAGRYPQWWDVQVNLAIATLNRQQDGDEQAALERVSRVLEQVPGHLRAHYVSGLLLLYRGDPGAARGHFAAVAEADPGDAYAAYYLAQCLAQLGEPDQALARYQQAIGADPYLRSAYYGAFQSLQGLGRGGEAQAVLEQYQRLENNPRARLAEFKYTRMGPKGAALAVNLEPPLASPPPSGPLFAAPRSLPAQAAAPLTAANVGGDERLDLFAPGVVLMGTEAGFTVLAGHPLAAVLEVRAAAWGDFDNDGLIDVYLLRDGPNQLWRQTEPGRWTDVSAATGTGGGDYDSRDGAFFDADHDGDLDLFVVNADGPDELFNNNRDGRFRPLAQAQGLAGEGGSRALLPVDFDGDRDVDIIVIKAQPPHAVYRNDRLWRYVPAVGFEDFLTWPVAAILAGDADADGRDELYSLSAAGELRRRPGGVIATLQAAQRPRLALADLDGAGGLELIASDGGGWTVLDPLTGQTLFRAEAELLDWLPVLGDPAAGFSIVGLEAGGGLRLWPPGEGRYPVASLQVSGQEDPGHALRSNASGIGTRISARVGSRWTVPPAFRLHSGPGQGLQPSPVGLAGAGQLDFVTLDWPDGVFQTELGLPAGPVRITETQRQLSSCPVLFAWDGEGYAFVTDFLGVGGLGYALGPGEYATPRPWEKLLLPAGLPVAAAGRLRLKVTEPMEESAYLDGAFLVAYDLPPGWQLVLDERMGILDPPVTGESRYYRRERLPVAAWTADGQEVTGQILNADGQAAPVGELDSRFIGRLAREQVLTLRFAQPLPQDQGLLIMDGWVEYPYSQTQFAAWQAGAAFLAPTLEAKHPKGDWQVVWEQFGYPAGMPRRASLPLGKLPAGVTELRLRTNQEIYWDRLAVAYAEPPPAVGRQVLPLMAARQRKTGFARRSTGPQRLPHYDYQRRAPFWDTRYPAGFYTRFGPVEALVDRVDAAVAIIGPGEEVHLEYQAPATPPPEGWTRRYVLETHGWAKDMDLFTRDGETVGPLPGPASPGREALHRRYNTRFQAGR